MTDRELLELAAKAAGWVEVDDLAGGDGINVYDEDGRHEYFDPLTDDGDALRLAVKLGLQISQGVAEVWQDGKEECYFFEDGENLYAATRRAITRAAAEIGKTLDK
jgi:hypothetical protein